MPSCCPARSSASSMVCPSTKWEPRSRIAWRVALDRRKNTAEISLADAAEAVFKLYAAGESAEKIAGAKQMAVLLDQLIATLPGKLRAPMLLSLDQ